MKTQGKSILCLGILAILPSMCLAKMASFDLGEMVTNSHMIVVGNVDLVFPATKIPTGAVVRVLETWKGPASTQIVISTSAKWVCAVDTAKKGETILLFVWRDPKTGELRINYSGRGRMPIHEVNGKSYADFWPEVMMPKQIEVITGANPECGASANLNDMKKYIQPAAGALRHRNGEAQR